MTETEKWINESLKSLPHLCAEIRRLSEENDALRSKIAATPPNDPLTLEELREKDERLSVQKPPIPGDTVWVIERDEYEEPIEISGYMFFAFVGRAAIVSSFINDSETLDEMVEYHIEETLNNYDTDLSVFPKNDCYLTRDAAKAALKKEGTAT